MLPLIQPCKPAIDMVDSFTEENEFSSIFVMFCGILL